MFFKPKQLSSEGLDCGTLELDKKKCKKFGPCGVGELALYLNSFYLDRRFYVPFASVERIFKRVAMSKGGFTGRGIFASIPYLVVVYDHGQEKQCIFKREEEVDTMIAYVHARCPDLPIHSEAAWQKLQEKEQKKRERRLKELPLEVERAAAELAGASDYLNRRPELFLELSKTAKRRRTYDRSNPAYRWVALAIMLLGIGTLLYGIYSFLNHAGSAVYFLLFGFAGIFLFSGANVLPTARNNKKAVYGADEKAQKEMEEYLKGYPDFPVPARYAHPLVLGWMREILLEGRAKTVPEALDVLKKDLKALNSGVTVEQEEFDEIMAVKPMFLNHEYK